MSASILRFAKLHLTEQEEREQKALEILNSIRRECRPAVERVRRRQARRRLIRKVLSWRPW
jgi:hypothetical protein